MSTPASTQVRRPAPRRRRLDASLIVGIALIVLVLIGLFLVFRRFGRR